MLTSVTRNQRLATCNNDITTIIDQETFCLLFSGGTKQCIWLIAQIHK